MWLSKDIAPRIETSSVPGTDQSHGHQRNRATDYAKTCSSSHEPTSPRSHCRDFTEHRLIARIRVTCRRPRTGSPIGIGDDAADRQFRRGTAFEVLSVDALVEACPLRPGVHAARRHRSPRARRQPQRSGGDGCGARTLPAVSRPFPGVAGQDTDAMIGGLTAPRSSAYGVRSVRWQPDEIPRTAVHRRHRVGRREERQALTRSGRQTWRTSAVHDGVARRGGTPELQMLKAGLGLGRCQLVRPRTFFVPNRGCKPVSCWVGTERLAPANRSKRRSGRRVHRLADRSVVGRHLSTPMPPIEPARGGSRLTRPTPAMARHMTGGDDTNCCSACVQRPAAGFKGAMRQRAIRH